MLEEETVLPAAIPEEAVGASAPAKRAEVDAALAAAESELDAIFTPAAEVLGIDAAKKE